MRHLLGLIGGLAVLWLLLSGHYAPLTLTFGALSCVATALLCRRLGPIDGQSVPLALLPRLPGFALWLIWQIMRASVDVSWRILRGRAAISPRVVALDLRRHTPVGQAILANATTLTPGSVTVGLEDGQALVHALTQASATDVSRGELATRVARLESGAN